MVCLDTTFIIDVLRGKEEMIELEKRLYNSNENLTIASPTAMEVITGALLSSKPNEEKNKVKKFLDLLNIISFSRNEAEEAGKMVANLKKTGKMIEVEDIMIGAIAKVNNQTLITKNIKHFSRIEGLNIETY
jgi:tRNA(fMet)-specific endonuclease VapC